MGGNLDVKSSKPGKIIVFYNEQCLATSFSIDLTETLRVLSTFTVLQNADWARLKNSIGSVFDLAAMRIIMVVPV